jgi:hypothetical protein
MVSLRIRAALDDQSYEGLSTSQQRLSQGSSRKTRCLRSSDVTYPPSSCWLVTEYAVGEMHGSDGIGNVVYKRAPRTSERRTPPNLPTS